MFGDSKSKPLRQKNPPSKFFYEDIKSVAFGKAGFLTFGCIDFNGLDNIFCFQQGGKAVYSSRFVFGVKNNAEAEKAYEYISKRIAECKLKKPEPQAAPVQAVSAAEELAKFKGLLDSGVITQEEFDAKKKQLLGL